MKDEEITLFLEDLVDDLKYGLSESKRWPGDNAYLQGYLNSIIKRIENLLSIRQEEYDMESGSQFEDALEEKIND